MAYKFYSSKLAQQLELKNIVIYQENWRLDLSADVEVWYTWLTETRYVIARGVFATATYEGGLNSILAPPCEGALGPLTKRSRQTFFGAP